MTLLGAEGDLLHPNEENCRRIQLEKPIITNSQMEQLKVIKGFRSTFIHNLFLGNSESYLGRIFREADQVIAKGATLLILTDRYMNKDEMAIPTLLAVSALHHHLYWVRSESVF